MGKLEFRLGHLLQDLHLADSIRRAKTGDLDQRKAFYLEGLLEYFVVVFMIGDPCAVGCATLMGKLVDIEIRHITFAEVLGVFEIDRRPTAYLYAGHAVEHIIENHYGHVRIASRAESAEMR